MKKSRIEDRLEKENAELRMKNAEMAKKLEGLISKERKEDLDFRLLSSCLTLIFVDAQNDTLFLSIAEQLKNHYRLSGVVNRKTLEKAKEQRKEWQKQKYRKNT